MKIPLTISITALILATISILIPNRTVVYNRFPEASKTINIRTMNVILTAYSASPDETDDSPRITASNQEVRDGIVANNCLEFGQKVEIDDKIYEVQDRKNRRYDCEWFDVFIDSKEKALEFGIKRNVIIKIHD